MGLRSKQYLYIDPEYYRHILCYLDPDLKMMCCCCLWRRFLISGVLVQLSLVNSLPLLSVGSVEAQMFVSALVRNPWIWSPREVRELVIVSFS